MKTALMTAALLLSMIACSEEPKEDYTRDVYAGYVKGSDSFALELRTKKYEGEEELTEVDVATTYTVSDLTRAELVTNAGATRLVPKAPGVVMVRPANGVDLRVHFTEYTAAQLAAGKLRYETGRSDKGGTACKTCHGAGGIAAGVHERWMSSLPDATILKAAETGKATYPDFDGDTAINDGNHTWQLTGDERIGIVAYIRSLEEGRVVPFIVD